jgi:hypothetical protein
MKPLTYIMTKASTGTAAQQHPSKHLPATEAHQRKQNRENPLQQERQQQQQLQEQDWEAATAAAAEA